MLFARLESMFIQKGFKRCLETGDIKNGLDRAVVAAATDERAIGALSQHQAQRANEDRFTGTGLARDDVVTRLQVEGEVGHQGEAFEAQAREHVVPRRGKVSSS